jgi:membrane protein implicated in regulation of membrane protease activity
MAESTVWWLLTGAAIALELVTGTFYLLMLAIGLAAGALAAQFGASQTLQLVLAALVGVAAVAAWQGWRNRHPASLPASANPDVNLDIGQTVQVMQWGNDGSGHTHYRGADWTVVLDAPTPNPQPGPYRIVAIEGSRLLVQPL